MCQNQGVPRISKILQGTDTYWKLQILVGWFLGCSPKSNEILKIFKIFLKFSGIWWKNYNLWWQGFCINKSIFTYGLLYDLLHFFWHVLLVMDDRFIQWEMVFCYQNCSDLLWEKIVLVIEKNFEAEGREFAKFLRSLEQFIQTVKGQNNFW